jgi:hypothetical protein
MVDEIRSVLEGGGSAIVEVQTSHRFTGAGNYFYSEQLTVMGGGPVTSTGFPPIIEGFSNADEASQPGRPSGNITTKFEHHITLEEISGVTVGGEIYAIAAADAHAELGPQCGEIAGGEVFWRYSGAVLRLNP